MEFKIDTKTNHAVIQPQSAVMSAIVAESLQEQVMSAVAEGVHNFIIDMSMVEDLKNESLDALAALHAMCYGQEQSLIFTEINNNVAEEMEKAQLDGLLNLAPTMQEAVDVVSMEVLERDLFGEE